MAKPKTCWCWSSLAGVGWGLKSYNYLLWRKSINNLGWSLIWFDVVLFILPLCILSHIVQHNVILCPLKDLANNKKSKMACSMVTNYICYLSNETLLRLKPLRKCPLSDWFTSNKSPESLSLLKREWHYHLQSMYSTFTLHVMYLYFTRINCRKRPHDAIHPS